jgi:hypothetical protein
LPDEMKPSSCMYMRDWGQLWESWPSC